MPGYGGECLAMEVSAWLGVFRRLLAMCVCIYRR